MDASLVLTALVVLPGAVFLAFALLWLVGVRVTERVMSGVSMATYSVATFLVVALAFMRSEVVTSSVEWFTVGEYHFPLSLTLDWLSFPFVGLTVVLTGIISAFSVRYLHLEPGFQRFFLLLHLFAFGSLLLFTAGSLDLLLCGWELLGITSVLLIGFFQERPGPTANALRVFGIYRTADIGLLLAIVALHHFAGTTVFVDLFPGKWPQQTAGIFGGEATAVVLLLLLAAAGKSAQGPFGTWLPRAMEGPTPSSAIFYGAISVHAGCYLLLRFYPLLQESSFTMACIFLTGLVTAVMGTLVGRSCTDAKGALAYASLSQVGVIFVEIGLGFPTLALWHISGHAIVRTLQFLRAPSALHEFHQMHAATGGHLEATGQHYRLLLPAPVQRWLYRLAVERGFLDTAVDRIVTIPLRWMGERLLQADSYITGRESRSSSSNLLASAQNRTVATEIKTAPGELDA